MAAPERAQLLEAAERRFQGQGFHTTGIDPICAAAGLVPMTLYNHFPSKEALVLAVLQARHERFLEMLDKAAAASPAGGTVDALLDAHNTWLRQHGRHGCIMVRPLGEYAQRSPGIHALALAAKADIQQRVAAVLERDGLDPRGGLALRIFLLREGCSAPLTVLGADAALAETRRAVDATLLSAGGVCP